jgi:hypothetical protein
MAYQINKTNGTIVSIVADGQIDDLSTSLTLIGKNYSGFGESLNENFVKLLENFANTAQPTRPITGQVWFDTGEAKLKVYTGTQFLPVSSAVISSTRPSSLAIGDLWFDNSAGQLYFFDGTNPLLLAPVYSSAQGLSGLKVDSILDTQNQTRVITSLYNNGTLIGIFATNSFTPKNAIIGFSGNIQPGFNAGTLSGIKFNVTVTNSEQLGGALASRYVRNDTLSNELQGQLSIKNDEGLIFGLANNGQLRVSTGDISFSNRAQDKSLAFNVNRGGSQENAVLINASDRTVSIYTGFSDSELYVGGALTVEGDLTVNGTTTTVNTANVTIEDKNIIIADVPNPTNGTADGGGITIKGLTDKTFNYVQASNWMQLSESLNLEASKGLYIGGTLVIDGTSLGSAITSIPGVTSFGTQNVVNIGPGIPPVTQMRLQNNRLSTVSNNDNIELAPDGTGDVALIGSPKITGLADPTAAQDAATKEYVDATIESRSLTFSMDLSDGKSNSYIITNILNNLSPVSDYRNGTVARILCTLISNGSSSLDINSLRSATSNQFLTDLVGGSAPALTNLSFSTAVIPAQSVSTTRIIKTFTIQLGVWIFVSETVLPP